MSFQERTEQLLNEVNARLIRGGKHNVYGLPNGNTVTISKTPSDGRAWENAYHTVRRAAGLIPVKTEVPNSAPRQRVYRQRHERREPSIQFSQPSGPARDLAGQLSRFLPAQQTAAQ